MREQQTMSEQQRERLIELFDLRDEEFLKFDRVEKKLSQRADLHAFMLLDRLCPGKMDIVAGAEHDEIYLEVGIGELAGAIKESELVDLIRCGVRYNKDFESLCMFA